ncbi:MAG: SMC-Scp complex subunit ScpB [Bdellovibrionaceae bacterium]|nr:SMC-Scp complex subunit ScpB [Pseudobdellovibrionaceae bacterium]NUM58178.1 SMC-Scp complex subunit ScpB [Pseudobdellovibrionaceae bacterium]
MNSEKLSSLEVSEESSSVEDKEALQRAKQMSFQSDDENKAANLEGTELDEYESVNIEDLEFVDDLRAESIIESILFATDKPVSVNSIKLVFKGTNIKGDKIRKIINKLTLDYSSGQRGIYIEEVTGGYQLRTKLENMNFLKRTLKARPFKLSGPALEVLAIVAYKQPVVKHELDEIRGVESGHLLRALMEKGIVTFAGKSDLPGKPMQYITTKKFLEIFGLRNLKELPTLSQIDELLPEGINEDDEIKNSKLSSITDSMSQSVGDGSYSQGEDELIKISEQLDDISTSSDFFEQEKQRQKEKKEFEKAQNIREALELGEAVPTRDKNWLIKYDEALAAGYKTIEAYESFKLEQKQQQMQPEQALSEADIASASETVIEESSELNAHRAEEDYQSDADSIDFEEKEDELPYIATDEELEGL